MTFTIRYEQTQDAAEISQLITAAFKSAQFSNHNEQDIVDALRQHNALTVGLVALNQGKLVGFVAMSPVKISDGTQDWYGLGPVAVLPEYQNQGIGASLINSALSEIKFKGAAGCVVLGEPDYYQRFGFKVTNQLELSNVPPSYFQAISFGAKTASGQVSYHSAFSV